MSAAPMMLRNKYARSYRDTCIPRDTSVMAYFGTASCYMARVAGTIPRTLYRVLRGGRFSEKLTIPLPKAEHRVQLLSRFLQGTRMQHELTISDVQSDGASPADLQAVCIAANA